MKKVLILMAIVFFSCSKEDCTQTVNLPVWDPIEMTFVDNFQEVPCDLGEPVDQPVSSL
jgi:hypothetical protein